MVPEGDFGTNLEGKTFEFNEKKLVKHHSEPF